MSQEKNYQVNYTIDVEATEGTKQVMQFANAVGKLVSAKVSLSPAISNIQKMMNEIDATFRTKSGKKRDYSFSLNIKTNETEEKLGRVKNLISDIKEMTKDISLVINAGQKIDSRSIKSQTKAFVDKKSQEQQREEYRKTTKNALNTFIGVQQMITRSVGKVNAALVSLEKGHELNIKTDVAKGRLVEVLSILRQIKGEVNFKLNMSAISGISAKGAVVPFALNPESPVTLSNKANKLLQEKLYTAQKLYEQKSAYAAEERSNRKLEREEIANTKRLEKARKEQEAIQKKSLANQIRIEKETAKRIERELAQKRKEQENIQKKTQANEERSAMQGVRNMQRKINIENTLYGNKRRAAINRIQYSKAPSVHALPFVGSMLNAYMAYSFIKSELGEAIDYNNIMESAHSILKVADNDLSTFEVRFQNMAQNVRQIGIDTKFTAVEIADATKYLAMAGMDIETINASMRPITNLALIGDNDVAQIADLTTNIMSGYNIKNTSMGSVADILSSTVSRSNVNVLDMAEAYKMAGGYLKISGVDFTESAAGIGVLGNMGIKGTMAGTALRAMATRFAKPTAEAQNTLNRLGVKFTQYADIYGKQVEKLRPLADIFEDLKKKGATTADMQTIFGKIAGNAAMMFIENYDLLRRLTTDNAASHGISDELALVKQNTTKGLWAQVTSQLTESFMQGYELVEPVLKSNMKSFLEKFKAPDLARGLASIGSTLLDIFTIMGNIGTWMARNFSWIEPLAFTGLVATRLFKLAGALTNVGVALGFIGKQSIASSSLQLLNGLTGIGGVNKIASGKGLSFANKRTLVKALASIGISGKGSISQALGIGNSASSITARSAFANIFSSQVTTGSGLSGAAASVGALGTGAIAATAGIATLIGALGWVAYKTWKIKEAKDAVLEETNANKKYRYPSIEALHESLKETYTQAINTKQAVDDVTGSKTIEEASGQKIGLFTGNWWTAYLSTFAASITQKMPLYTTFDAYQDDTRAAIKSIAEQDSQAKINSAYADLGKLKSAIEVRAYIKNIDSKFKFNDENLDKSLWTERNGKIHYKNGIDKITAMQARQTIDYANFQNNETTHHITVAANAYLKAIESQDSAIKTLEAGGFDFSILKKNGYSLIDGVWTQKKLGKNASDKEREELLAGKQTVHDLLVKQASALRKIWGGSGQIAENIMQGAGFTPALYSNNPDYNDAEPYNANAITNGGDDGMAGGNYSGTGKLSSAAPKQVIVNISNLLSVKTIDLLKSPDGQLAEIQNLKEQLAEALIDVVHDFDATWNS